MINLDELIQSLQKAASALSIIYATQSRAGCSDQHYRNVVSQQIAGIVNSGILEELIACIDGLKTMQEITRPNAAKAAEAVVDGFVSCAVNPLETEKKGLRWNA